MMREVLALAVVAKAAKISSMVDSCRMIERQDGASVNLYFPVLLIILQPLEAPDPQVWNHW